MQCILKFRGFFSDSADRSAAVGVNGALAKLGVGLRETHIPSPVVVKENMLKLHVSKTSSDLGRSAYLSEEFSISSSQYILLHFYYECLHVMSSSRHVEHRGTKMAQTERSFYEVDDMLHYITLHCTGSKC